MTASREPVGVLGGTFDPVHHGHLHVARNVLRATGLSGMLLVPSSRPPHKRRPDLSPARHREAMLRLAVAGEPGLEVSSIEIERDAISYTIDTLRLLRVTDPAREPVFVLGMDALLEIATWHEHEALLREFDLIVVDRPGSDGHGDEDGPSRRPDGPLGGGGRIFHVEIPRFDVSASEIRARVAAGLSVAGLVPDTVARYIRRHGLYELEDRPD